MPRRDDLVSEYLNPSRLTGSTPRRIGAGDVLPNYAAQIFDAPALAQLSRALQSLELGMDPEQVFPTGSENARLFRNYLGADVPPPTTITSPVVEDPNTGAISGGTPWRTPGLMPDPAMFTRRELVRGKQEVPESAIAGSGLLRNAWTAAALAPQTLKDIQALKGDPEGQRLYRDYVKQYKYRNPAAPDEIIHQAARASINSARGKEIYPNSPMPTAEQLGPSRDVYKQQGAETLEAQRQQNRIDLKVLDQQGKFDLQKYQQEWKSAENRLAAADRSNDLKTRLAVTAQMDALNRAVRAQHWNNMDDNQRRMVNIAQERLVDQRSASKARTFHQVYDKLWPTMPDKAVDVAVHLANGGSLEDMPDITDADRADMRRAYEAKVTPRTSGVGTPEQRETLAEDRITKLRLQIAESIARLERAAGKDPEWVRTEREYIDRAMRLAGRYVQTGQVADAKTIIKALAPRLGIEVPETPGFLEAMLDAVTGTQREPAKLGPATPAGQPTGLSPEVGKIVEDAKLRLQTPLGQAPGMRAPRPQAPRVQTPAVPRAPQNAPTRPGPGTKDPALMSPQEAEQELMGMLPGGRRR